MQEDRQLHHQRLLNQSRRKRQTLVACLAAIRHSVHPVPPPLLLQPQHLRLRRGERVREGWIAFGSSPRGSWIRYLKKREPRPNWRPKMAAPQRLPRTLRRKNRLRKLPRRPKRNCTGCLEIKGRPLGICSGCWPSNASPRLPNRNLIALLLMVKILMFSFFPEYLRISHLDTEKGKEKEGKAEEEKLFPAQKELISECLTILLAQLAKPVSSDKGLFAVILFIYLLFIFIYFLVF